MNAVTCPSCGYSFKLNAPGVDTSEQPYFTYRPEDGRAKYFCSSVCLEHHLDAVGVQFTEPRGDDPPRY